MQLDIVFAMPHPDDLEITCGGTIAKLARLGHKVGVVHLTNGEPTPLGTPEARAAEAAEAARILGVAHVETLPLTNRELMDGPAARYALATVLRRHRPRIVVGMAGRTPGASPDHYQGQLIVEGARFYSQLTKWDDRFDHTPPHRIDWLWYRPVHIAADIAHWHATFVVDISDVYEQKVAAISAYRSQFPPPRLERLLNRIRAADAVDGGHCGFACGELFALPHPFPTRDPLGHFASLDGPMGPPALESSPRR
ncbi:MAG: PIG-L family deacetylase [Phycisphaerae bacterium]|nr:PIG-L family deacetylase [Phycisphaerae bacterium]MCZ2401147.1 PIG-L family deacetylase [Phycisphaerae bacterium]NUQ50321.1 PIG-L family deacetylase [Phycisphaerae bacterium]